MNDADFDIFFPGFNDAMKKRRKHPPTPPPSRDKLHPLAQEILAINDRLQAVGKEG